MQCAFRVRTNTDTEVKAFVRRTAGVADGEQDLSLAEEDGW